MVFPEGRRKVKLFLMHTSRQQDGISEAAQPMDPVPGDGNETQVGGYVDADKNDEGMEEIQTVRPQRVRRPPERYGIYVEH